MAGTRARRRVSLRSAPPGASRKFWCSMKRYAILRDEYGDEPIPYPELLLTVEWQEKRLIVLTRDARRCRKCGCSDTEQRLQVHHEHYILERLPWEYPEELLVTMSWHKVQVESCGPVLCESSDGWNTPRFLPREQRKASGVQGAAMSPLVAGMDVAKS